MTALPAPVFSGRSASSFLFLSLRQYGRDHRPAPYTGCNIPPVRSKLHIGSGGQRSAPHCKIQQRALHGDVCQLPLCILQRKRQPAKAATAQVTHIHTPSWLSCNISLLSSRAPSAAPATHSNTLSSRPSPTLLLTHVPKRIKKPPPTHAVSAYWERF